MSWVNEYEGHIKNPPEPGTVLRSVDGSPVAVEIDIEDGKVPFLYAQAYVPSVVGGPSGWYAQHIGADPCFGWKCILLPKAREEVIKKHGVVGPVGVAAIRVIRRSKSGQSFLIEVAEW